MKANNPSVAAAIGQVRRYIRDREIPTGGRLPSEGVLAGKLGVTRGLLRQALAPLEASGEIWRGVGRGTFVGDAAPQPIADATSIDHDPAIQPGSILDRTNPVEVLEARLLLEPKLASLAALHGTPNDFRKLEELVSRQAGELRSTDAQIAGGEVHRCIAAAAHNALLGWLFDCVFAVRDNTGLGMLSASQLTDEALKRNLAAHRSLVEAITNRDAPLAATLMRVHLEDLKHSILEHVERSTATP